MFLFSVVATTVSLVGASGSLRASAWQSASAYPNYNDFPEHSRSELSSRPSTAIAFTGGGSRSYLASVGYLAGLNALGLIPNIRYISGISGGSWATLTFSYSQLNVSDDVLLGQIVDPSDITREGLQQVSQQCMRHVTNVNFVGLALDALKDKTVSSLADAWAYATQRTYYEPFGIKANTPFSWSEDTVSDIKARNPSLADVDFVLPTNSQRPYPMVGTAIVGPTEGGGYDYDHRNFTMIEITPLYVGQMRTLNVTYTYDGIPKDKMHYRTVGGIVESFAFGRYGESPTFGLGSDVKGVLVVPTPESYLDIQFAGAASSYAPGAFVESITKGDIADKLGLHIDYWSPVDRRPSVKDSLFCDGGSYENIMLPSMLQRRVQKIVLFFNDHQPLQPASVWNVAEDEPSASQVTDSLSSLFGIFPSDATDATWEKRSFDNRKNQFFSQSDWVTVATGLQQAQEAGNGIVFTAKLITVENDWWGVPAGIESEITFVYLGRLKNWEAQLSEEMRSLLVPSDPADASNLAVDVDQGPFRGFPHYFTAGGLENTERANVLSDMTGWTILNNADLFRAIFA